MRLFVCFIVVDAVGLTLRTINERYDSAMLGAGWRVAGIGTASNARLHRVTVVALAPAFTGLFESNRIVVVVDCGFAITNTHRIISCWHRRAGNLYIYIYIRTVCTKSIAYVRWFIRDSHRAPLRSLRRRRVSAFVAFV
jgi:hypothetical protein